jgi:hypothetical protein
MTLISSRLPVFVNTGSADRQGFLLFVEGELVGVIVRLERAAHADPDLWGRWFLESGFGPCRAEPHDLVFAGPEDAEAWARERVGVGARRHTRGVTSVEPRSSVEVLSERASVSGQN